MPQRASVGRIHLKPTQERVLAALSEGGTAQLTRGEYEVIAGVSRSQAAYDLAELVEAGVLERLGGGRSTRYRLARREQAGQRRWTDERIRAALIELCAGRKTWPSASKFKEAGRSDLYVAASRYGGIGLWASELGYPRPGRAAPPPKPTRSWRPSLQVPTVQVPSMQLPSVRLPRLRLPNLRSPSLRSVVQGATLIAGALLVGAGAAVLPGHDTPTRQKAAPRQAAAPKAPRVSAGVKQHPTRGAHVAKAAAHAGSAKAKQAHRAATRVASQLATPRAQTSSHAEFAVATVPATTRSAASTQRQSSGGPAPLPAPRGGGAPPAPIPPPGR